MKNIYIIPLLLSFCIIIFIGCNKDKKEMINPTEPVINSVTMVFENRANGNEITLDGTEYTNSLNQSYQIRAFKYFISNVEFYANNELIFKEKDSYHYINQKDENTLQFTISGMPEGSYDEIRYSFGIDEEHNNGDSANGDISPSTGMFWFMGGYRFSNFDGEMDTSPLTFHTGGNANYRTFIFNSNKMEVEKGKNTIIHSRADVNKMFEGKNTIDFTKISNVASETSTMIIAENIEAGMFSIYQIDNPK